MTTSKSGAEQENAKKKVAELNEKIIATKQVLNKVAKAVGDRLPYPEADSQCRTEDKRQESSEAARGRK